MIIKDQVFFDEDNLKLFFLSPYVDIAYTEDEICLRRFESDMMVCIPQNGDSAETAREFLRSLKGGLEEEDVRKGLYGLVGDEVDDFLDTCMLAGIIE